MFRLLVLLAAISCVLGAKGLEERRRIKNKHWELWDTLSSLLRRTRRDQKLPETVVNILDEAADTEKLSRSKENELNKRLSKFAMEEMEKMYAKERRGQILRKRNKCKT